MEHEISFKKFQQGQWAYLFRFSTFSWNFPVGWKDKMFSIFYRTKISENFDKMESALKLTFVSEMRLELFLVFPQKLELRQFGQLPFYWNCIAVWSLIVRSWVDSPNHKSPIKLWELAVLRPSEGRGGGGYAVALSVISETACCLVGFEKSRCRILTGMKMPLLAPCKLEFMAEIALGNN